MWNKKIKKIQRLLLLLEKNVHRKKGINGNIAEVEHIFFECFNYDRNEARTEQDRTAVEEGATNGMNEEEESKCFKDNGRCARKVINIYFIPYVNLMLEQLDRFRENYSIEKEYFLTRILNFLSTVLQINRNYSFLIVSYYVNLIEQKSYLLKIIKYLKSYIICLLKGLLFSNFSFIEWSEPIKEGFKNYVILKSKIFNILTNFHFDEMLKNSPYKYDIIKNLLELITKEISFLFFVLKNKKKIFRETINKEKTIPEVINEIFDYSLLDDMINKVNLNSYNELIIIWIHQDINVLNQFISFNLGSEKSVENCHNDNNSTVPNETNKTEQITKTVETATAVKMEKEGKSEKIEKSENIEKSEKIEKLEKMEKVEKIEKLEKIEKIEQIEENETAEKIEKTDNTETRLHPATIGFNETIDAVDKCTESNNAIDTISVDNIILLTYLMKNIFKLINHNPFILNFFINNVFFLLDKLLLLKEKYKSTLIKEGGWAANNSIRICTNNSSANENRSNKDKDESKETGKSIAYEESDNKCPVPYDKYKLLESVLMFIKEELYILLCKDDISIPFFYCYIVQLLNLMGEKGNISDLRKKKEHLIQFEIQTEEEEGNDCNELEIERDIETKQLDQTETINIEEHVNDYLSHYQNKNILKKEDNCYKKLKNEEIDIMAYLKVKVNGSNKENDSTTKKEQNEKSEMELQKKEENEKIFINKIIKKLYLTNFKLDKETFEKYDCARKKKVLPSITSPKKSIGSVNWYNTLQKKKESKNVKKDINIRRNDNSIRVHNEKNKYIYSSNNNMSLYGMKKKVDENEVDNNRTLQINEYKDMHKSILSNGMIYFDSFKQNEKILQNIDLYYFLIFTQLLSNDLDNSVPMLGENIYIKKIDNLKIVNNIIKRIILNDMLSSGHKYFFLTLYILKMNSLDLFSEATPEDIFLRYSAVFKFFNNVLFYAYIQEKKKKLKNVDKRKVEKKKKKTEKMAETEKGEKGKNETEEVEQNIEPKERNKTHILAYTKYCYNYYYKIKKKLKTQNRVYRSELEKPQYRLKCTYDEILNLFIYSLYKENLLLNFRDQYIKTFIEQLLEMPKLSFSFFTYIVLWLNNIHIHLDFEGYINATYKQNRKLTAGLGIGVGAGVPLQSVESSLTQLPLKDLKKKETDINKEGRNSNDKRKDIRNDEILLHKEETEINNIKKNQNSFILHTNIDTTVDVKSDMESDNVLSESVSSDAASFFEINWSKEEGGDCISGYSKLANKKNMLEKSIEEIVILPNGHMSQQNEEHKKKHGEEEKTPEKSFSPKGSNIVEKSVLLKNKDTLEGTTKKERKQGCAVHTTVDRKDYLDTLFNINKYITYSEGVHVVPNAIFCFSILSNLIKKSQNINAKKTFLCIYINSIYMCHSDTRILLKKLITAAKGIYNNTLNYCYVYTKKIYNYLHKIFLLFLYFVCINFFPNIKNDLFFFSHFPCYVWPIRLLRFLQNFLAANFSSFYNNLMLMFSDSAEKIKQREHSTLNSSSYSLIEKKMEEYLKLRDEAVFIELTEQFLKETDFFYENKKKEHPSSENVVTNKGELSENSKSKKKVLRNETAHRDMFHINEEKECFQINEITQKALIEEIIVLLFIKTVDLFEDRLLLPIIQKVNAFFNFSRIEFVDELCSFVLQNVESLYEQENEKIWEYFDRFMEKTIENGKGPYTTMNTNIIPQHVDQVLTFLLNAVDNFLSISVRTTVFFHFYLLVFACCSNKKMKLLLRKKFIQTLPQLKPLLHEELVRILEYNNEENHKDPINNELYEEGNEKAHAQEKSEEATEEREISKTKKDSFVINIDIVRYLSEKLYECALEENPTKFLNCCFNLYLKNQNIFFIIELIAFLKKDEVLQVFNDIIQMQINENEKIELLKTCINKIVKLPYKYIIAKEQEKEIEMEKEMSSCGKGIKNTIVSKKFKTVESESYYIKNIEIFYFYYNLNKNKNIQRVLLDFFVTKVNVNSVDDMNAQIFNDITIKDLACIIQQIAESTNAILPIYGRFLCQVTKNISILREFISSIIIPLLVQKKIWNNKSIWKGCLMCISMLWPDYNHSLFYIFFMLPPDESVNLFQALQQKHPIANDLKNIISSNEQAKRMCPEHLKNLLED